MWAYACPESFVDFAASHWQAMGVEPNRFQCFNVALASLSQLFEPPEAGKLRAFFDISAGSASCVLTDASGWVFSRWLLANHNFSPGQRRVESAR